MDLNELTLGQIREIKVLLDGESIKKASKPFHVGKKYLIRTVTMIYVGECLECHENRVVLGTCSWIPETARWSETLATGEFNEVEPYGDVAVTVWFGGILDHCQFLHPLPTEAK